MTTTSEPARAQFAGFELDLNSGELLVNGQRIRLQGQPFLVLRILLENAGAVVTARRAPTAAVAGRLVCGL